MENAAKKYRYGRIQFNYLENGSVIGRIPGTEIVQFLKPDEAGLLLFCNVFQTLAEHALAYANRFPEHAADKDGILKKLQSFAEQGFLADQETFSGDLFTQSRDIFLPDEDPGIEAIGIPTANRAAELDRALASFIANVTAYGRTPEFVIADDSEGPQLEENRTIIEKHRKLYKGSITHLDLNARRALAKRIADAAGLSLEAVTFALAGDSSFPLRTGALRNSILMHAAGKKILFVDDDVICNVRTLPGKPFDTKIESLLVTSSTPRESWHFKDYESAVSYFPKIEADYLGAHEIMLGKHLVELVSDLPSAEKLHFAKISGGSADYFLERLRDPHLRRAKINTTFTGAVGHSSMTLHLPTMILSPDPKHSLWGASEEEYIFNRTTPFVAKVPGEYSIYGGQSCTSLNVAMDATTLVPPFSPLYRGQDTLFGFTLRAHFPNSFGGFIPLAVEHRRNDVRIPYTDPILLFSAVGKMTMFIMRLATIKGRHLEQGNLSLAQTGYRMLAYAQSSEELKTLVLEELKKRILFHAEYSTLEVARNPTAPEYWKAEIFETNRRFAEMADGKRPIPFFWDVENWQTDEATYWKLFAEWIKKYGAMLVAWPTMYRAARSFNKGQATIIE